LDFFFDREPFSEFATDILNLCEENKIKGFTTPVIICNTYYLLRKTAKHDIVIEKIKQLLTIIDVLKIDKEVVLDSLNSNFKDFEDALQNYSAVKNGKISIVLTRNIKDYKKSELAVMTPETYLRGTASS
uniref:PIN domain-containing protein n=1 Tax=uncultured Christiangramia sp. TaxID=503836 RepID=UPI0026398FD5